VKRALFYRGDVSMDTNLSRPKRIALGFGATLEVALLLVGGALFMRWAGGLLGLESYRAVAETWSPGDEVPWGRLALHETIRHVLRYGPIFAVAFAWGWWWFRWRPADYGLSLGKFSWWKHLALGAGLFVILGVPTKLLIAYTQEAGLGEGPKHWQMIAEGTGPGFWAFMAVTSFLLPPLLEEIYMRGYAQTRLTREMGATGAVLLISVLFAAAHTQYYALEVTSLVMLALIFVTAAVYGFTRQATGSLIAPVVSHMLANVPWG
jgi:membrane protease YdiL (CAAX protease family)